MATREMRICDVYGTTKDILPVSVVVSVLGKPDEVTLAGGRGATDMSPAAIKRLIKFIARGMTPTAKTKKAILTAEAAKAAAPSTTNTGT